MSISSFKATTASFPNKIDLEWTLNTPLIANERLFIRRSESIYPLPGEGEEILSTTDSTIISFTDEGLSDLTFYYYAAYIENTSTGIITKQSASTRDRALSYKKFGEGDRLFSHIPTELAGNDFFFGGHLEKLFQVIGNQADYILSRSCVMEYFRTPAVQDEKLLDFYAEMYGFSPERGFDLRVLRNLALSLIGIYKKKGTCRGLVEFTKAFTTWDSRCDDSIDLSFKWWDPNTKRRLEVLDAIAPRTAIDSNATFSNNIWTNGKFVDPEDDPFYTVLSNNATDISFANKTPPFNRLDGTDGVGIDPVTFEDATQSWTTDQWKGHRLYIPSFSSVEFYRIVSNDATQLFLNPLYTNYGTPEVLQQVDIDVLVPSTEAYRIEPEYYVQQGRHSLFFDNTVPAGFRGLTKDPAHFYFGSSRSLLTLGDFSDQAVILIIENVAYEVGRSTGLTTTTLTDTNANFGSVDSHVGRKLNPNILQSRDFEIIANTATTITVSGDMLAVAATGNNYYIVDELDSVKTKRLREVLPLFAPYYADLFVFFEPKP